MHRNSGNSHERLICRMRESCVRFTENGRYGSGISVRESVTLARSEIEKDRALLIGFQVYKS